MEITLTFALVVGITMALVEIIKRFGITPKLLPIIAIILSFLLFFLGELPIKQHILTSIVAGLSAMGLFSGTKATIGK